MEGYGEDGVKVDVIDSDDGNRLCQYITEITKSGDIFHWLLFKLTDNAGNIIENKFGIGFDVVNNDSCEKIIIAISNYIEVNGLELTIFNTFYSADNDVQYYDENRQEVDHVHFSIILQSNE